MAKQSDSLIEENALTGNEDLGLYLYLAREVLDDLETGRVEMARERLRIILDIFDLLPKDNRGPLPNGKVKNLADYDPGQNCPA